MYLCIYVFDQLKFLTDKGTALLGWYNSSQKLEELELGGRSKGPGASLALWAMTVAVPNSRDWATVHVNHMSHYNKHQLLSSAFNSACATVSSDSHLDSFTDLPIAHPGMHKLSTVGLGLPLGWQLRCSQVLLFPAWNAPNHLVYTVGELSKGIFSFTALQIIMEASTFGGQFSWNPRYWNGTTEVKSTEWNVDESF